MQANALSSPLDLRPPRQRETARLTTPIRTTFERFEVKYWVSALQAKEITDFARPYLVVDPHAKAKESQHNTSLYFDTHGFLFWRLHRESAQSRYKLRIRAYGSPPRGLAFFEVKQKTKDISRKVRATVPLSRIDDVLACRLDSLSLSTKERGHIEAFLCIFIVHRAEPKVVVRCRREPFVSRTPGEDVRVTLDSEIGYRRASGVQLGTGDEEWTGLPCPRRSELGPNPTLIELKFRGVAPAWVTEMVQRFSLRREAFSKYCAAIDHLRGGSRGATA